MDTVLAMPMVMHLCTISRAAELVIARSTFIQNMRAIVAQWSRDMTEMPQPRESKTDGMKG
jgi:hypothetical protein